MEINQNLKINNYQKIFKNKTIYKFLIYIIYIFGKKINQNYFI